ncbi:MAG TPA: DNA polymerase III subunit delta' [Candidatus Ventricola gallistercoris]|nr:DNA polymerase III subunit delta' [Candidatus Ventricola gallistercoris]
MFTFEDFAGQSAHLAQLQRDFSRHAFVHAYLFAGPRGTGKRSVARLCAMAALCRGEGEKPCGQCGPCRRVLGGTHPDVHTVLPEKDKKWISVGVMRELLETVSVKSFEDGVKVILIPEAERMNAAAQNCLLKTLEEPPQDTVFFLITDQPAALLPTVVSRCRVVRFHPLDIEAAAARLVALGQSEQTARARAQMAEGCVGQALEVDDAQLAMRRDLTRDVFSIRRAGDVLAVVNAYKEDKGRQAQTLDALEAAVRDILLAQAGRSSLDGAGYAQQAQDYARSVPLSGGLALMREVTRARMMCESNVAFASAFEAVLLKISEEYAKWPW